MKKQSDSNPSSKSPWKNRGIFLWREWIKPILVVLLITGAIRSSLADWNDVPTGSMKPTIVEGDRIWVNKLAYDLKVPFTTLHLAEWDNPKRGEIVVFFSPADGQRLVKRCVALPGDTVAMVNEQLYINGKPLAYESLDSHFSNEIPESERPSHEFQSENLTGRQHPVMTTPERTAIRSFSPYVVPEGHYFMMGDNRDNSYDSRYYGPVERKRILGRATAVVISGDPQHHYSPRWHRFFSNLP